MRLVELILLRFSSLLSDTEIIYELQTHDALGGKRDDYLRAYKSYADAVSEATRGAQLFGYVRAIFARSEDSVTLLYPRL